MKVKFTSQELGESFKKAQDSICENPPIMVKDQVSAWKTRFHATITGGHFDNIASTGRGVWNTKDAIIEFDSKEAYMLFLLEWS